MNATFKLPSVITEHTALDPLESLRSPKTFGQKSFPSERDSIARSEFNDVALDDDPYFPVPLTAQPGMPDSYPEQPPDEDDITAASRSRVPSLSLTLQDLRLKSHRKTASTTTIRSTHESIGRLDFQEHNGKVTRASVDGQMKLQEEFARLQEMETKDHNQTESSIDWGEY
jgi:ecotropic viral integration site 5 protein